MRSKNKKQSKGKGEVKGPAQKRPLPRKRYALWAVGVAAVALAAIVLWPKEDSGKPKKPVFKGEMGEEPTLYAQNPRLQLLPPEETGVSFQNQIIEDEKNNIILNLNQYNGGGVAVGDFNNDGLTDIYFVNSSGKNALYLNKGNFKFEDITDAAGVGSDLGFETSATAADVNADGWLDIYVCRAGPDPRDRVAQLFINNANASGAPTFTERAAEYGLDDRGPCSGANFFDYDLDGDLDCYVINHPIELNHANRIQLKYGPDGKSQVPDLDPKVEHDDDHLYRNDSPYPPLPAGRGGKFVNVSKQAGIQNFGFGLSVSVSDLNYDGWPDIYVGNDFVQPDNLFINNQKGGFTDEIKRYMKHSSMSTMGADLSDFDGDGLVDVFTVDMFPSYNYRQKLLKNSNNLSRYLTFVQHGYLPPVTRNVLQRNNGNGTFSDLACMSSVFKTDWSWSCLLADFDNDGLRDLHVANGYRRDLTDRDFVDFIVPEIFGKLNDKNTSLMSYVDNMPAYKIRNFIFQNKGNWEFEDKSGDWMTMPGSWSNGGAWADFDGDGDLDLVVNNLEQPAFIYKNLTREQGGGNYLQAKLQGSPKNPFAVGASVLIEYAGGLRQYQELNPNHGIFSSVEHLIHFGLGKEAQVARLSVRWPDGKFQVLENVPANQRLTLKWADAAGYVKHLMPPPKAENLWFAAESTAALGINFEHTENYFNDFETWVLNPWSVTDQGPLTAVADLNGDGLDDFFIGGAKGQSAGVFLQAPSGKFAPTSAAVFKEDAPYEDHGALFFDANGDRHPDLFVLSGGAEAPTDVAWQCRLYLNDGKGNFTKQPNAFSAPFRDFGLRAATHDYDGDGDLDLFVGGRLVPKNWPLTPRSVVLRNDRGRFTDATAEVGGDFERCGMVTDLAWADLDGDGRKELIAVGEWMPVRVFSLENSRLKDATERFGFDRSNGFWNRLALADLDGDGDLDLVTGNLGRNTRFDATPDAPFLCYAKDFDNNGTLDPVVAFTENGKTYPLMQKEVLVKQMPGLKKKVLFTKDYAQSTMNDLFSKKDLNSALQLAIYDFSTCWWENQGGKFARHNLPPQAQASPANGILCADFNGDGHTDILLAGNKYGFEVETNPCNAGTGTLLLGNGKGQFTWRDNLYTGFWAQGEARDLALLSRANGKRMVLVGNNNGAPQVYFLKI